MADADLLPRFCKVYVSHLSSDSMVVPVSYNDELPNRLPKTAILQGPCGGSWKVSVMKKEAEVHFAKGWAKFVEDHRLCDGDYLTFVYDGNRIFEVSIYRHDGCKDVQEEEDKEDVVSLSSEDTETEAECEMIMPILRSNDKGKLKEEDTHGDSENYSEAFGRLDVSEDSNNSDSSYLPSMEYPIVAGVKPKEKLSKKKGKSKLRKYEAEASSVTPNLGEQVIPKTRAKKAKSKIKNPEQYLDDPMNANFETSLKIRSTDLYIGQQLVKDYDLKFEEFIHYNDGYEKLKAKAKTHGDGRVVIAKWAKICKRNGVKNDDGILCELLRKQKVVYEIKVTIIRAEDL